MIIVMKKEAQNKEIMEVEKSLGNNEHYFSKINGSRVIVVK